jgi:hypothetical protein
MHTEGATEVVATDEFREWYRGLDDADGRSVTRAVDRLEMFGTSLPFPYSSAIVGSRYPFRELRIQSAGRPLRVFYIFDPRRDAVLIIGGNKAGNAAFYERMIPRAEIVWEVYGNEQGFKP